MRSFSFTEVSQLEALLSKDKMEEVRKHNQIVWNSLEKPKELLKLFDGFNDKQSGKRIVNYIKNT